MQLRRNLSEAAKRYRSREFRGASRTGLAHARELWLLTLLDSGRELSEDVGYEQHPDVASVSLKPRIRILLEDGGASGLRINVKMCRPSRYLEVQPVCLRVHP